MVQVRNHQPQLSDKHKYHLNEKEAHYTGERGLQAHRDISAKSTEESNLAQCDKTANEYRDTDAKTYIF